MDNGSDPREKLHIIRLELPILDEELKKALLHSAVVFELFKCWNTGHSIVITQRKGTVADGVAPYEVMLNCYPFNVDDVLDQVRERNGKADGGEHED
jgi:hypothetical protein